MRNALTQLLRPAAYGLCATLMALSAPASLAQNASESEFINDWFQVEVVIFARPQINSPDAEKWPKNIALAYPPNLQMLIDPNAPMASTANEGDSPETASIANSEPAASDIGEIPFTLLPSNARLLNAEANAIARSRSKRVLFHEAWRQPMLAQQDSPAIVISGGETFDKNRELEGTITIWVSRYLHMTTNLWFTSFETNYGQESEHWPYPPEQPKPYIFQEPEQDIGSDYMSANTLGGASSDNADGQWHLDLNTDNSLGLSLGESTSDDYFSDFNDIAKQPYVVTRVATLQQRRRMRSTELHYIDHPLLGVLIQIERYDPENPPSAQ